ncbi:MAG: type IX secretion system sortase PorU [Saprospiraceae bacterium]
MKKLWLLCMLFCQVFLVNAADPVIFEEQLDWYDAPVSLQITETKTIEITSFEDAIYTEKHPTLPIYNKELKLDNYGVLEVQITNEVYESYTRIANDDDNFISNEITINKRVEIARRQYYGVIQFVPIRKNPITDDYERLVSFDLTVTLREKALPVAQNPTFSRNQNSVLADGNIYKFAVAENGVYKLTYDFLKNELGISNLDDIDPRTIKLLGNEGGILPEANVRFRHEDVPENAIVVVGENDGSFDANDYILFYGESPNNWLYSSSYQIVLRSENTYTYRNHYYIKISAGNGKRIEEQPSINNTNYSTSTYDFYGHHEVDAINLLDDDLYRHGSGKIWYGETFKFTRSQTFDFNIPNITSDSAQVFVYVASRDVRGPSNFLVKHNNQTVQSIGLNTTSSTVTNPVATNARRTFKVGNPQANFSLQLDYQASANAEGYLNYISVNARRNLVFYNGQMSFRDRNSLNYQSSEFLLNNANNITIWDVTNTTEVKKQLGNNSGETFRFGVETAELKEFIAFDGSTYLEPEAIGKVDNQNLHGLTTPDLVIIYHPIFEEAVQRLAAHRRSHSNMTVEAVEIGEIYNEFGSGSPDPTAVRDFMKYLYDNGNLKYLLLFGDASFDFRNVTQVANNQLFVPTYETSESLSPITAFPLDDYFGLLDVTEGSNAHNSGSLDIGIGRFPVKTLLEANQVVDKLIDYETNPANFGDWKNRITFIADDEDTNTHTRDANTIADRVRNNYPIYNVDKIFIDAYRQEVLPAGERYPDAENAIYANVFKGNLIMCYLGHGDSKGLAQERIIDLAKIASWSNGENLPLFVTATCSFGPYDDHREVSIGEELFLKPKSGAISLFTTTRLVFASSNKALTQSVFDNIFEQVGNDIPPLGEILRKAKNTCIGCTENSRKFVLLGDPSMSLVYPKHYVHTNTINSNSATQKDTIQALQEVTVTGEIRDKDGNALTNFNGTIYPTVFDKIKTRTGLGNDARSRPGFSFDVQNNILFRGRASVVNGQFSFNFIVPKDIDYQYGYGKISYYADNGINQEAWGYLDTVYIGGTYQNAVADNEGPQVEVFMNDENFVFGGMTDENPVIYVKLSDDSGINTSSAGIGHGISAILDENTQQSYSLNDFYESKLDDYRQGIAQYPLSGIEEGVHQITVKAWDVANNSGTGYTEFVVASAAEAALDHVLNYPNPFTTNTEFQFEHNLPNQPMQVQIQIFTVSGKLVKTIQEEVIADGYRVTGIEWNGTDDFGNPIGRGVYVYKVSIGLLSETNQVTNSTSEFQKLVILK